MTREGLTTQQANAMGISPRRRDDNEQAIKMLEEFGARTQSQTNALIARKKDGRLIVFWIVKGLRLRRHQNSLVLQANALLYQNGAIDDLQKRVSELEVRK